MLIKKEECKMVDELAGVSELTFVATGVDGAHSIVKRGFAAVSIDVERHEGRLCAALSPNLHVPKQGSAREKFQEWLYDQDDERYLDLHVDEDDGEILHAIDVGARGVTTLVPRMMDALEFIFEAYPSIVSYVATSVMKE